jgi:type IV pilus biogenesis protein CpaD/CtpE
MIKPRHHGTARHGAILGIVLLALAGCALDPYTRSGTWRPSGANEANLRLMVADPRDYQQGVSERGSDGQLGADAVTRFRAARSAAGGGTETTLPTTTSAGGLRTN